MVEINYTKMTIIICLELIFICLCNRVSAAHEQEINFYSNTTSGKLRLIFLWESVDFAFPDENARQEAIESGEFVPGVPMLNDIDVANVGTKISKVFVTFPRYGNGIPATLGYILNDNNNNNNNSTITDENIPVIIPFPNWERNKVENCSSLISVYRIKTDECGRLWVLDSGKIVDQMCPPKLLKFDLNTDKFSIYEFPEDQYKSNSLFVNLAVDIRGNCSNTFVYIADVSGYQLVVYDDANNNSWNIKHDLFSYYPEHISFTIAGMTFNQTHGIFGLALSPSIENGDRILYFHSLASVIENFVYTSILRESSHFETYDDDSILKLFKSFKKTRSSQAGVEVIDKNGILFSSSVMGATISCWNTHNHHEFVENLLDDVSIVTDQDAGVHSALNLKIISSSNGRDELWINSVFFVKNNASGIVGSYFKVQAAYIDELVKGTKCSYTSRH